MNTKSHTNTMTVTMTNLIAYGRISAEVQVGNTSLQNQLTKCVGIAAVKDCKIVNEDTINQTFEQASGSSIWRPGLWLALQQLKCLECEPREMPLDGNYGWFKADCRCGKNKGADGLVVNSLDRLSRSTRDLIFLMEDVFNASGKRLIVANGDMQFDTGTPQGALIFGIFSLLAEFEKNTFKEKMTQEKRASREMGRHTDGAAPFGFFVRPKSKQYDDRGHVTGILPPQLLPLEPEVVIVKEILFMYYQKISLREITKRLNASSLRPRKAKEWNFKQVSRIIHGPDQQMHQKIVRDSYNEWHIEAQARAKEYLGPIAQVEGLNRFK